MKYKSYLIDYLITFLVIALLFTGLSCASSGSFKAANPEAAENHFSESLALSITWDFDGALRSIQQAIELDPNNAKYIMFRGTYEGFLGDRLAPLRALDRSIELEPDNPRYYNNRAAVLQNLGLYKEALRDVEEVFAIGDIRMIGACLDTLAWVHYYRGEYEAALAVLDRQTNEYPELAHASLPVRFRIIQETEGIDNALAYGQEMLNTADLDPMGVNAMHLLMGQVDLRDIEINHIFELTWYMAILVDYEFQSYGNSRMNNTSREDLPVLLIRDIQTIRAEEELGPVLANAVRSILINSLVYRIVDNESRLAALKEIEFSLSGLTDSETDIELGKFLSADFILSGSLTFVQGQYLCNVVIADSSTSEITFSKFFIIENFQELVSLLEGFARQM